MKATKIHNNISIGAMIVCLVLWALAPYIGIKDAIGISLVKLCVFWLAFVIVVKTKKRTIDDVLILAVIFAVVHIFSVVPYFLQKF